MDLLLVIISIIAILLTSKLDFAIVVFIVLGSNYLGMDYFFEENHLNYFLHPSDAALILLFIIIFFSSIKPNRNNSKIRTPFSKYLVFFVAYLFLTFFIDIVFNGIDLYSIIRTSRHWLFLLVLLPFSRISIESLSNVLRIIFYISLLCTIIILIEFVFGISVFTSGNLEREAAGAEIMRGALPSTYAPLYALLIASGYNEFKGWKRIIILMLFIFSLLVSAAKSLALAIALGFVVMYLLRPIRFSKKISLMMKLTMGVILVLVVMPGVRYRLMDGTQNINNEDDGSATFRALLVAERIDYLTKSPQTFLFGVGNVTEDNFHGHTFYIGTADKDGTGVRQLDTGDIAWALAVLRLGIIGTVFWVLLFVVFISSIWRHKSHRYAIPLISYILLNLLIISTANSWVFNGDFWVMPLLFYCLIIREAPVLSRIDNKV